MKYKAPLKQLSVQHKHWSLRKVAFTVIHILVVARHPDSTILSNSLTTRQH